MAITKGAKKAHRSSLRKKVFNVRRKKELHDVVKEVEKHIGTKNLKDAEALLPKAYKAIDKAAKRGIIKPNTAARKKSRLTKRIKKTEGK